MKRVKGVLAVLLVAALPASRLAAQAAQRTDTVNRLMVPEFVQNRTPTTSKDDALIVQELEHKIRCTCGCGLDVFQCRTTDFTCATSPAMHRLVLARMDSGMTSAQVIAAFEQQYGQSVLMQPPKRGFNWAAYVMPFAALIAGLGLVSWLMRRWIRRPGPVTEAGVDVSVSGPPSPVHAVDEERLRQELERFEA